MGQAKTQCVTFILSKVPRAKAKTQKHKTQTPPKSAKTHKTQNTKHSQNTGRNLGAEKKASEEGPRGRVSRITRRARVML